jgi:hypothetical protein
MLINQTVYADKPNRLCGCVEVAQSLKTLRSGGHGF